MRVRRALAVGLAALGVASCEGGGVRSEAPPHAMGSQASLGSSSSRPIASAPGEMAANESAPSAPPAGAESGGLSLAHRMYWDESGEPCRLVRVTPSGSLILHLRGAEREIVLARIELPDPLPPAVAEVIAQSPRRGRELRCVEQPARPGRPAAAVVKYFLRHDKAADVWDDIGATLVLAGLARVADADFHDKDVLDKEEYRRRQARARAERRGIWATPR